MGSTETIISIILVIGIGYFARRLNLLKTEDSTILNKIVVNLAIPSLIFISIYKSKFDIFNLLPLTLVSLFITFVTGSIAFLWCKLRRQNKKDLWSIVVPSGLVNSGFLGYPIVLGVYGITGLLRAIFYDMGSVLSFIIFGIILGMIFSNEKINLRSVFKHVTSFPPLIAMILGVIANLTHLKIYSPLLDTLHYLGNATVPLIMLSLGLSLKFHRINKYKGNITFVSLLRLLFSPLLATFLTNLLGIYGLEKKVLIVESAMPSAMLSIVLSVRYRLNPELTAICVFTTTLLSLITIPFVIFLLK